MTPLGSIDRRSEIANAQPLQFGLDAQVLGGEQGIGRGIEKPREIVIGRVGIALPAPHREAVHIGADRHHARSLRHHRLVEVARGEPPAQSGIAGHNQRVELHVAACRSTRCRFENLVQHVLGNWGGTELTYRTMLEKHTFHGNCIYRFSEKTIRAPAGSGEYAYFPQK